MHKKYTKFSHRDHHHHSSSTRKIHVKCRKDIDDGGLEAPQNSRSELNKKLGIGSGNAKENSKHKHKHKHKKSEETQPIDRHAKSKHEKKFVYNLADMEGVVLDKEAVNHKEKKEKREKERLNKIEKYLEGLDKTSNTKKLSRNRSLSLGSSESVVRNQEMSFRREKTFHEKPNRDTSTNNHVNTSEGKDWQHTTTSQRKKSSKKHKHDQSKERESSKEKNTRDTPVSYCQIETQNPFLHEKKKYRVERLYPEGSNVINEKKSSRRRSSSRDSFSPTRAKLEPISKNHKGKTKESREKKMTPIKFSPRRSKLKTDLKNYKDQQSNSSLGPYRKYYVFDERSQTEREIDRHGKKKHRKVESRERIHDRGNNKEKKNDSKEGREKPEKSKKNQEKSSSHATDNYKDKIEDDIKSYFTKIQTLIDKKLDFILGSSNSKETKNSSVENNLAVDKTKSTKTKKGELEDEERPRDRSHSKKKRIDKHNGIETQKREKDSEEDVRVKHSEGKKSKVENRRAKDIHASNTSLKRERYPSADSRGHKQHPSPQKQWPYETYASAVPAINAPENANGTKQDKRNKSPFRGHKECKIRPDQLINMLEHPSTVSLQSDTSLMKEPIEVERKRKSYPAQRDRSGNEHCHRRDRSAERDKIIPDEQIFKFKGLEDSYLQEGYNKKMKRIEHPFVFAVQSNTYLSKDQFVKESKHIPECSDVGASGNGHYQKRDRSPTKRCVNSREDDVNIAELEPAYLQEIRNKKMKHRMRQMMNLECTTVSIVGIPSQIRESTIFNETQTTTSLNVINQIEDCIEKKKKSKRFKLYYKYSVADNKCSNDSDKSSEGKKSIVSDSYKVVSDPSDQDIDTWEQQHEESNDAGKESANADLAKILFIMKNEKFHKNCGDVSGKHGSAERTSKKHRKRCDSPKPVMLNNILEEPSNISIIIHQNETPPLLNDSVDCTFFNSLKSSSSDCDLELTKKKDCSIISHKHKNRHVEKHVEKHIRDTNTKPKSPWRKSHEKDRQCETMSEKKSKCDEKCEYHKHIRKMESYQKIKKKQSSRNTYKFSSKSDINISYDSLTRYKHKEKKKVDTASHLREQLKHLLPELPVRKPSPEIKSIDVILKEELRQIIKQIPRSMACKETSFDDLVQIEAAKSTRNIQGQSNNSQAIDHKDPNENQIQQTEEKTYCSKKIGTHQAMTRIPSLIKKYVGKTASQIIETHSATNQVEENVEEVDDQTGSATGLDVTERNMEMEEITEITLENKMSQTPTKVHTAIEVAIMDTVTQNKTSKKVATTRNTDRCRLLDPLKNTKIGCTVKPTRPIINLENNHFPNRKAQEANDVNRPASSQYRRQKSSMSEGRTVKFKSSDKSHDDTLLVKPLKQRPVTVGEKSIERPKTNSNKFQKKPTKSTFTMSTNIITINSPSYTEKCTETCDVQTKPSKKNVVINPNYTNKNFVYFEKRSQEELSTKSTLSLNDMGVESRIGSLVCVDKHSNHHKTNYSSNSNSRTLDQYTKSIISDNPNSSRLFLTKNFSTQMNTYQRRKMYDESIRKKMKKRVGDQNQMGPSIFEVRYLTLESDNLNDTDQPPTGNHRSGVKLPTFNTKINKPRQRVKTGKPSIKKSRKNFPKNKEDACKFSGRDIFAPLVSDVDQLNKFRRKTFPEKNVEEIFVKDGTSKREKDDIQSSSAATDDRFISSEHLNSSTVNKSNKENADQNFKELIDCLYNSIISYCNSKFKLPQEEVPGRRRQTGDSQKVVEGRVSDPKPPPVNEKSYVIFPKSPREKRQENQPATGASADNGPFKNSSSEGNVSSEEKQSNRPTNLVGGHLSCPVLAGSTSSFDYLYEDGSIELNKEDVLLHFRKPMKTILGYAFNNTHHAHKQALFGFPKKQDQISNSATDSEESGYSSNNSKKCTSVCSFFKKPSIANLFKPVKRLEGGLQSTASSVADSRSGPNLHEYDVMNQKCIEYAEKVRIQSQNRDEPSETFQEIPLDVLLFCRKSFTHLGDFNSNCSLCKRHSSSDLPDITELDELNDSADSLGIKSSSDLIQGHQKHEHSSSKTKIQAETLIFYKDPDHRPSLEIISFQKSEINFTTDNTSKLIKETTQCPVVLSITNLNTCSLTIIEESENDDNGGQFESGQHIKSDMVPSDSNHAASINECCNYGKVDLKSPIQVDLDSRSDISSNSGFRNANSSSATSKYMAKRFFDNLLKVYEKEMSVTNKLFQDEEFFAKILLESVRSGEVAKTKNTKLKELIKRKIKDCIGNVLFSKSGSGAEVERTDTQTTASIDTHQRKLQILAGDARQYFSMFVQAVKTNKDINDEVKICGLLKLLDRIEDGDFAVLRKREDVDFEEEIKEQVKEAFVNIYQISVKEAKKRKRSLTDNDLQLIRTFVSKYRIGLLSKTDLIASYIGRGVFKTEGHLKAAVTYLIQQNKNKDVDLKDFHEHCKILEKCSA